MKQKIVRILNETPGLTGRQIAKSLGLDKRAVNSFLSANSDGLVQIDWKWYPSKEHVVRIGGQRWVDASMFESSLCESGCFLTRDSNRFVIQFLQKCQILLIAGARIIALVNQIVSTGKDVVLDFKKCPTTKNYFVSAKPTTRLHRL